MNILRVSRVVRTFSIFILFFVVFVPAAFASITYINSSSGRNDALPTNGTAGNLTITKPAGVTQYQGLIASIAARPRSMTYTAPPGWILMTTTQQNNGGTTTTPGGMNLLTFYKIVTATEPSDYTWTFANPSNSGGSAVGGILAFSGIDTTSNPINVFSANLTASGTTHSTTSITTTVADTMIVSSISFLSASNFANPTGITGIVERLDQSAPLATNAIGTTLQMATVSKATAGATGGTSAVAAGQADNGIGHLMALRSSTVDIALTMTRSGSLIAGGSASYTLAISNNGTTPEAGPLTVVNTLPTGLTFSTFSGSGWSCSAAGQAVTCTRNGAIAAGASAPALVIDVNVASGISGTITNTATASGTGGDSDSSNNTAVDTYVFPVQYVYYAMEETSWGTGAGVVVDSSGNGRNASALGSASPTGGAPSSSPFAAIPGNPGTCGAGQIPGGTTAIGVNTAIDVNSIGNTGTIMFWYSGNQGWNDGNSRMLFDASNNLGNGGADKHFYLAKNSSGSLTFALEDSSDTDSTATSTNRNFPANEWHHIAVTWDMSADRLVVYLDGNTTPIVTSTTNLNGTLGDTATLYFGAQRMANVTGTTTGYTTNTANGYIDEVRIYQGALSATEIAALKGQTHTCGAGGGAVEPESFNCVETGLNGLSGHLYAKQVSVPFAFDVVALKDADNNGTMDSVETTFASQANKTVTVELVDGAGSISCNLRTAVSPPVSQSLVFTQAGQSTEQGRKIMANMTVSKAYPNLRCRITDANQSPNIVACSTDNFSVRPSGFTVTSNANADASGSNSSATPVIKSGANFTLTAASGAVGYNTTPKIDASKINAHTGAAQTGSIAGSFNVADSTTGIATGAVFTYSEVGYFNFGVNGIYDDSFTAVDSAVGDCSNDFSNTAVSNLYGCYFGNTAATPYFGRFIPDHFAITPGSATPACSPSFTYFEQDGFSTLFTLIAQNTSNSTTQNYQGGFARLGLTAWSGFNFSSASLPSGSLLSASATAPVGVWSLGVADVMAKHQAGRPTALTGETSVVVQAAPVDSDGVTMTAAAVALGTPLRYGRLNLQNAHGSELLQLPVSLTAQYWNGSAFVLNTDDNCTTVAVPTSASGLTFYPEVAPGVPGNHLSSTETTATVSATNKLVSGDAQLKFSAPGGGNDGYFDLTMSAPDWLKFDWNAANAGDESPSGRITFGIYKGNDSQIYLREVY